ncbi:3-hydroxyacyl-CoA dehydrogenase family protein [Evansella halocellulosilytica]|uniref:3-hydroxyacyl-CoA dehydrogenase family protein n=1 Tax=Evansella halocellulosilytica TaxID=2011013 RepID=UPI000BB693C4|nr:3-hydroxyacyl-CoA dehydrogenase NAD-binding domain-containing protein [Evansella halocellulosilytica]
MRTITVIGSGTMGKGIGLTAAISGFNVRIQDISEESLNKARAYFDEQIEKSHARSTVNENDVRNAKQNISFTTELQEATKDTDLVIEAIPEVMELKTILFQELDQITPNHTILATNTSTMSPTEIAAQTNRPDRCIAMHFFNPVPKMKLIEVICGLETSEQTINRIFEVGKMMNKECVKINEFPGFAVSRMNCLIGNEAMTMLMEGVSSVEGIDKAMKLGLNHPMGPLELADLVGLDTRLHNMEYLHQTLGEKYRPCPLLVKYVKAGRLGRKSGKGFYTYST